MSAANGLLNLVLGARRSCGKEVLSRAPGCLIAIVRAQCWLVRIDEE